MSIRLCHHCHAPQSNPVHAGILTGAGNCTLQHWEECQLQKEEGYDKHKKWWTGCPNLVEDHDKTKDKLDENDSLLTDLDDDEIKLKTDSNKDEAYQPSSDESEDETEEEEDRLAAEEVENLRLRVEEQARQIKEDESLALRVAQKEQQRAEKLQRRADLEKRRAELMSRESQNLQQLASAATSSGLSKSVPRSTGFTSVDSSKFAAAEKLKSRAAAHAAKQQKAAADLAKLRNDNQLNIGGIRKLQGMNQVVENHLVGFQSAIPSLARDPTAHMQSGAQFQPSGVLDTAAGGLTVAPGYVYVAELGQLVPTVSSLGSGPGAALSVQTPARVTTRQASPTVQHSDTEVSADEDCPVSPAPGYRLVWRVDSQGRKYCEEKAVREQSPEIVTTWVKRSDGRIYKEQVTDRSRDKVNTGTKSKSSSAPMYVDHRQPSTSRTQSRVARGPVNREERQPTFISTEERAGKDTSLPGLVKRARMCQVSWTDKITTDQLNPVIWSWAYIADLLASRTGQAEDLPVGELEARLQHFLNVMEVTMQTSNKTDFAGDSWKVGRLYHNKVQAKVDQGATTWCSMMERWESATLPHELMAAQQELAPKPTKTKPRDQEVKSRDADAKPPRCGTWNTWETRGICKYESEHPGQKCNYVHDCTYCKTKKFKPVNHQRLFCPKRIEAGVD